MAERATPISNRRTVWGVVLATCLAVSAFCLIYPVYVIRPFRHQGVREFAAALLVLRFRQPVDVLCVLVTVAAAVLYWRNRPRLLARIAAIAGTIGVIAFSALSRVNIYELMFHPLGQPAFLAASNSKLDGDEHVIAVKIGGAARAYPIRSISYHHIVNDVVGGVPIVATY